MFSLLLVGALALTIAATSHAMTADELIAKTLEASGGEEALKALQSIKMSGVFQTQGMEIPFNMVQKRPGAIRIDAEFQGMAFVQSYNSGDGWQINPMLGSVDAQDLSPMEMKSFKFQSDMDGLLIDYADKGYTAEYIGEDEVEGTPVHHLHLDTNDDATFDMYVDTEYFLVIKQTSTMKIEENEMSSDTYMSDFKEVGNLIMPHAIEMRMNGVVANTIMIQSVDFNVEVAEDSFDRPPPKPKEETAVEGS